MRYSNRLLCIAVCIMVIVFAFTDGMYVSQSTSEMTAIAMPVTENNKSEYRAWLDFVYRYTAIFEGKKRGDIPSKGK